MKLFILSPNKESVITPELEAKLRTLGEVVFYTKPGSFSEVPGLYDGDEERILTLDPDFCDWKAQSEDIDKIPNLKAICLQTTSFSWIDTNHFKEKGIPVTNNRGFSTEAVAEWAIMTMIALARKIPLTAKDGWKTDFVKYQGIELVGKTAGIIGLGRIGKRIAELCRGIGMNVIAWSHESKAENVEMVPLEEVFSRADVVFPIVADNSETQKLITDDLLKSMKLSTIFVSMIHLIYNHQLLLDMVKEGKLYGYGFESAKGDFASYEGNVWAGPQIAWATKESMRKNGEQWVEAIITASQGEFKNRVN
jgi:phosphoglycerate dehydrogenase-like enzyme